MDMSKGGGHESVDDVAVAPVLGGVGELIEGFSSLAIHVKAVPEGVVKDPPRALSGVDAVVVVVDVVISTFSAKAGDVDSVNCPLLPLLQSSRVDEDEAEDGAGLKSGSSFTIGGKSSVAWFDLFGSKAPLAREVDGELAGLSSAFSVSLGPAPIPLTTTTGVALVEAGLAAFGMEAATVSLLLLMEGAETDDSEESAVGICSANTGTETAFLLPAISGDELREPPPADVDPGPEPEAEPALRASLGSKS